MGSNHPLGAIYLLHSTHVPAYMLSLLLWQGWQGREEHPPGRVSSLVLTQFAFGGLAPLTLILRQPLWLSMLF